MTSEQEKELLAAIKRDVRLQKVFLGALIVIGVCVVPFAAMFSWALLTGGSILG